jgi:type II secretory pathway pseudopilin PulG
MATNEASGLIDIRAMASSLAAEAEKADDVDEMLSLGGGGFAPTLGAPILTATASPGMSTGVKAAIIGVSILVLALLVAGGIFMWRSSGNQKDDANSEQIMLLMKQIEELKNSKASPEEIKAVQQQLQNAKTDAAVKSGDVAEMPKDEDTKPEDDNTKSASSKKSSTKSPSKKADSKSDSTQKDEPSTSGSSTKAEAKPKGNTSALDALLGGASKPKPKTTTKTAPASSGGTKLTRSQVISGMNAVKASVSRCGQGQSGTFKIKAKIAIDGRVDSATPVGDFAGTPQGSCAARAVSKARFPRSSAPTTVTYPFKI